MGTMIDPVHALAFSVQSNRGVYAVLLGSGVSRASGIPTGWEVTLDLARRLAALQGDAPDPTPEAWYYGKYGKEPDYSDLLEALTKTPADRQQLLREYWEPDEQEREEGLKQPTAAHHAIAALAAQGFIRVILTTNFDHLMENALREAGIEPTVLSTPDQVHGALPLIHTKCCVIKLHGDYLDTRIRNTSSELESYSEAFNKLLDRILDEFGLIVCGWSAVWDKALRDSLYRCQTRRFATYWAVRGGPSEEAQNLINHRNAQVVTIESADTFFQSLQEFVEAAEEFSRPHPLSIQATVAIMKRYMSEPRYRIQLSDLVDDAVRKILEETSRDAYVDTNTQPTAELFTSRVRGYEAACSTLLAMAPVAGFWAEEEHYAVWERALSRLATTENRGGYTLWLGLMRYPALLLLFALGIGALEAGRLPFLGRLFSVPIYVPGERAYPAVFTLPYHCLSGEVPSRAELLPGMERKRFPMSQWIETVVRQYTRDIIPSESHHALAFTKMEIMMALGYTHHDAEPDWNWPPLGTSSYRREESRRFLDEIRDSLTGDDDDSYFVRCGIFGDSANDCREAIDRLASFAQKMPHI